MKDRPDGLCCETCDYWNHEIRTERIAACLRYPPTYKRPNTGLEKDDHAQAIHYSQRPVTEAGDWCGEHSELHGRSPKEFRPTQ